MRRAITKLADIGVIPAMYALISTQKPEEDAELAADLWTKLVAANALFSEVSADGPFFFGEMLSLADTSIVPFLDRFSTTLLHYRGFEMFPQGAQEVSRLKAMLDAARERPGFQATTQAPEFYINTYRSYCSRRGGATEGEMAAMQAAQSRFVSEAAPAQSSKL